MGTLKTISVKQFCVHYKVPISFIETLSEYELIEIVNQNKILHIQEEQITTIEKLMRLHYDLDINFEGLDVITNLINQIKSLQNEVETLNNKIEFYDDKIL